MSKLEKLYEKVKNNLRAVRFKELDKLLLSAGFERRQPSGGSSHYIYRKEGRKVTVPHRQPHILQVYVEDAIEAIGDSFEQEDEQ